MVRRTRNHLQCPNKGVGVAGGDMTAGTHHDTVRLADGDWAPEPPGDPRLAALLNAIAAVVAETDTGTLLRMVVTAAATLVEADYGAFAILGAQGDVVDLVAEGVGSDDAQLLGLLPERSGVLAKLISSNTVSRLDDVALHAGGADFSPRHPRMGALLGMPITTRGAVIGVLYVTRIAGRPAFTEADEGQLRALGVQAGIALANASAFEVGRRREDWLETLTAVATGLSAGRDLGDVLPRVIGQARAIVDADFAALALPSEDAGVLTVQYGDGIDAAHLIGSRLPVDTSLTGTVLKTGKMIEVIDLRSDPRVAASHEGKYLFGPALFIPVGPPSAVRGVLVAFNRSGRSAFDRQSVIMLNAFAAQVAVSLELAEHRRDDTRLALAEDRERIARDLHDVVIQRLFAIGLTLEGASRSIIEADAGRQVVRAVDELDQTIKEIRTTIFGLQASAGADDPSLRARIVAVVEQSLHALGFVPSLRFDGLIDTTVPDRISDQVVAVLREALSNAARHARATKVEVVLAVNRDQVTLLVDDDGVGITDTGRRSGLRNMEVRAKASGGSLLLTHREPSGTRIEWRVPLNRRILPR
jgi:signal transduction histidine kinase